MQNKPSSSSQAKYPIATTLFNEYENRKQKQKQKKLKLNRSLSYTKVFFFSLRRERRLQHTSVQ